MPEQNKRSTTLFTFVNNCIESNFVTNYLTMRKLTAFIIVLFFLLPGQDVSAQSLSKTFSFGIGLEGGLTTGKFSDLYSANGGLSLRLSYQAGPGFATLTSGAIGFIPKSFEGEDLKASVLIPVRAGYKYIHNERFFGMAEIGYGNVKTFETDHNDELVSHSSGGFLFAPSIGVQFGVTEIGLRYETVSLTGASLSSFGIRLGFNF